MPATPALNITAEIKTEQRTVFDYLLSPIQKTIDASPGKNDELHCISTCEQEHAIPMALFGGL